jgi:hypothetical protein
LSIEYGLQAAAKKGPSVEAGFCSTQELKSGSIFNGLQAGLKASFTKTGKCQQPIFYD